MRRIVEGLGLGLARRAARKLVPVVLTLGSGPSGFPRKPRRGRVARARSRNFDAGSWPVGLLETTFRATAEASATAMANPRRRTRALRYFGAGGWPVGLPETIFRATAKASATASLALASVVLALGVGPTGFPKQVSERCKAGGSWTPTAMANPRRRTRALRYFGAGGWPVGLPETIFRAKLPRQPWQTRAVARARSVILALGAGPSGFPKQVSERRKAGGSWRPPRHMRPEAYVATRAAQIIKGEGQASGRNGRFINQKRTSVPYKEFISGQAEQFLGRPAKRMATLSRPASRSGRFIKADGRFIKFYQQWPLYQGRGPGQWPQWPFCKPEAAKLQDLLDLGCGLPISYCPV